MLWRQSSQRIIAQQCTNNWLLYRSFPRRALSEWNQRGHDITYESLTFGDRPKVVLDAYSPTGFDVLNCVKKVDEEEEAESGTMHYNGSISKYSFCRSCFFFEKQSTTECDDLTTLVAPYNNSGLPVWLLSLEGHETGRSHIGIACSRSLASTTAGLSFYWLQWQRSEERNGSHQAGLERKEYRRGEARCFEYYGNL